MSLEPTIADLPIQACPKTWESLQAVEGGEARRFCDQCELHVHDLSALTRGEAKELLSGTGRVCVRKTLTPEGRIRLKPNRWQRFVAGLQRAASWFVVLGAGLLASCPKSEGDGAADGACGTTEGGGEGGETEELAPEVVDALSALGGLELMGYVGE